MKKITTFILFICLLISEKTTFAQTEAILNDGLIDHFSPWNKGYVASVYKQLYAVIPAWRKIQRFDEKGKLVWDIKVEPSKTSFNYFLVNKKSPYVYFIDSKFGINQKDDAAMDITQIDEKGKTIIKKISLTNELISLKEFKKTLELVYVKADEEGLTFVVNGNKQKYFLIRISHTFDIIVETTDFYWNETEYTKLKVSKPKFLSDENTISLFQTRDNNGLLNIDEKIFDLKTLKPIKSNNYSINIESNTLTDGRINSPFIDVSEFDLTEHYYDVNSPNSSYRAYTLGASMHFKKTDKALYVVSFLRNRGKGGKEDAVIIFELNEKNKSEIKSSKKYTIDYETEPQAYFDVIDNEFIFIGKLDKKNNYIQVGTNNPKLTSTKLSFASVFLSQFHSGKITEDELKDISFIELIDNQINLFEFKGSKIKLKTL